MHELSVTKNIYNIVQKHALRNNVSKVISVRLEIGALSDLENDWIQRYFDHLSKGSVVEGAKLIIQRIPAQLKCNHCEQIFELNKLPVQGFACSYCQSKNVILLTGREYNIIEMKAQ